MSNITVSLAPEAGYSGVKRSLVIAGGGMRVAYQAGVLRALAESDLSFFHADGTSGGTINLAMMFSGLSPEQICERWRDLDVKKFVSFMPLHKYIKLHDMQAMGDADGIVDHVFPHLGIDIGKINAAQGMSGTFNVCNYTRKTNEAVPHQALSLELLVAGISLPIFMPAVSVGEQLYTDSVWIKDANLMEAVRQGAEEIWLIWCIGNTANYQSGIFNQYVHMIELSANGGLFEEFDRINELNERIRKGDSPYGQQRPIRLHVIKPEYALPLDPDLYLGRINTATLISMGYADAKRYLSDMHEEGLRFEPEVTQMKDENGHGITFRETMSGGFSLGEIDPEAGAKKGKSEGNELSMHASITIHDIDAFISDPKHQGEIVGSVDFTPFGTGIPASKGVFNLFKPSDQPDLKHMVYELGFEHQGESYYLVGKKEVRDDPGFDLWSDTTTLFTRLYKGEDEQGQTIGAGVLTLGVKDLVKLVSTMRATNADGLTEAASVYAKFGRFFMGELWESYAKFTKAKD